MCGCADEKIRCANVQICGCADVLISICTFLFWVSLVLFFSMNPLYKDCILFVKVACMKYIITLSLIWVFVACKKPGEKHNEISKIELARSGVWSDFGASISIDSSLNYKYYGDYGKVKQGYFVGKVNSKFWDTLNRKLEWIKYKTLPISDNAHTVDVNYFELIVYWKNGERHISRVWNYPTDSVLRVIKWIDTSFQKINLHQTTDTIPFESKYHRKIKTLIDQIRFPPPIRRKLKIRNDK